MGYGLKRARIIGDLAGQGSGTSQSHRLGGELTGPPFQDVLFSSTTPGGFTRKYGIIEIPLQYEPGLGVLKVLEKVPVRNENAGDDELEECWLQRELTRKLKNLRETKVLVETGEASLMKFMMNVR
ncbi:hypothetical protein SS1G_13017 [Sclerotinia sclerotiorum 1980 UF-70]|uniref:Uncharacterized protein n=1 Tax=Sclerotinia sclerotiorum (strain ATCC 18683 / 1980 / Ss-1) TaxID=665079 RepID=A7F5Y9_SCLS1|nr:hypothetical protein SS1G_13017 [Sclerotinia sclerotiorum 1980 UF-70]EDN98160.1 hypothetical protein SS1G_13017 [Sclerotinia sclerotiorum 1980 UF-70]